MFFSLSYFFYCFLECHCHHFPQTLNLRLTDRTEVYWKDCAAYLRYLQPGPRKYVVTAMPSNQLGVLLYLFSDFAVISNHHPIYLIVFNLFKKTSYNRSVLKGIPERGWVNRLLCLRCYLHT